MSVMASPIIHWQLNCVFNSFLKQLKRHKRFSLTAHCEENSVVIYILPAVLCLHFDVPFFCCSVQKLFKNSRWNANCTLWGHCKILAFTLWCIDDDGWIRNKFGWNICNIQFFVKWAHSLNFICHGIGSGNLDFVSLHVPCLSLLTSYSAQDSLSMSLYLYSRFDELIHSHHAYKMG